MAGGTGRLTTQFEHGLTVGRQQPGVAPYANHFAQMSEDFARIGQTFGSSLDKIGAGKGAREGAEAAQTQANGGTANLDYNLFERLIAPARQDAAQHAYSAGIRSDIDMREKELRAKYAFDPEGYKAASASMIDGYISKAPPDMAMGVGAYVRDKANDGLGVITKARVEKDQAENVAIVNQREADLRGDIEAMAYQGLTGTKEYQDKLFEFDLIQAAKGNNPLFKWSPELAALEREKLQESVGYQTTLHMADQAFEDAGGGLAGVTASTRVLESAFGFRDPKRVAKQGGPVAFTPPVQGKITSGFGAARPGGAHGGVDIAVPVGTPVVTAAPGVIVGVGEDDKSGKFVRVRHADGSITSYAHLSAFDVQRGDTLDAGAVLGKSGNTGNSTGPHLHFRMRDRNGNPVDPTKFYGKELAGGAVEPAEEEPATPLVDLPPRLREKYFRDGLAHIRQRGAADVAEMREADRKEADARAAKRDELASIKLDIITGAAPDWRSRDDLTDGDRLQLEKAEQAKEAADRADANRDKAAAKAASGASYDRRYKEAEDGLLDDEALADDVMSGAISRAKAETLRTLNKKALKTDIAIVRSGAPDWYHKKPAPWPEKVWKERKAKFDEGMLDWLPRNLAEDDARKKQAGVNIGNAIYNPKAGGGGGGGGIMSATEKMAKLRALDAEYKAGRITEAKLKAERKSLLER